MTPRRIDEAQLDVLFAQATTSVRRIEVLRYYAGNDDDIAAWRRTGQLPDRTDSDYLAEVRAHRAKGVTRERLRVVAAPGTTYIDWELAALAANVDAGEDVLVAEVPDMSATRYPEAWLFDDAQAVTFSYDWEGRLASMTRHTDPTMVRGIVAAASEVRRLAVPLSAHQSDARRAR